jgi:SynChlorMet cassette radical SAM/SPASM protein ScmF
MSNLLRNPDYELRYVEPASGCGLLYNVITEDAAILDPVATVLWRTNADVINPQTATNAFVEGTGLPGASEYLEQLLQWLVARGLLYQTETATRPDVRPGNDGEPPPLQSIYFYCTPECNARCYHCYQPTKKVANELRLIQPGQLSADGFAAFLRRARRIGLRHVKITGGEALLRADLPQIINDAHELGLNVSLETNGYLLDEEWADFLTQRDVYVSVSLDGPTAQVHDRLRGHPGSFDRAVRALSLLVSAGSRPAAITSLSRHNVSYIEQIVEAAAATGCRLIKLNPVNTLGVAQRLKKGHILLSPAEIMQLYRERERLERTYGVFLYLEGPPAFTSLWDVSMGHSAVCPFTRILGILWDGSISFCGVGNSSPELVFGRVDDPDFDFERFWRNAPVLKNMRQRLTQPLDGVCGDCMLRPFCGGSCRALAYGEFRSFTAPHPWCQQALEDGMFPEHYLQSREVRAT